MEKRTLANYKMSRYSIRDLEKLTGIKAHTIRIWEKRYEIVTPERTETNIRCYSNCDLKRLLNISILNKRGHKISGLAGLTNEQLNEKVMGLLSDHNLYDTQIESLVLAMIDLNESKFEKSLTNAVIEIGFEETLTHIVHPFFNKIGILWQTGTISPAQEHFVSNLVRQKIIAAIENLETKSLPRSKLFILFLHEEEYHELGLLMFSYLIKKTGHRIIYLGQATPLEEVVKASFIHDPDFLLTSFTTPIPRINLEGYLDELTNSFPGKRVFVTGLQINEKSTSLPDSVVQINDPESFKQELLDLLR